MSFLDDNHCQDSGDDSDWVNRKSAAEKIATRSEVGSSSDHQPSGPSVSSPETTNPQPLLNSDNSDLPPVPPKNVELSPRGSLIALKNPALLAWYERYVAWALARHPTRTPALLSRDVAMLVPGAKPASFAQFVQRAAHPVARRLQQTIGEANLRNRSYAGGGKDVVDKIVHDLARASVGMVPPATVTSPAGEEVQTVTTPLEAATPMSIEKRDASIEGEDQLEAEEDANMDTDDEFYATFDRRLARQRAASTVTSSRRRPEPITPRSLSFDVTLKLHCEVNSASSPPSSPSPSPSAPIGTGTVTGGSARGDTNAYLLPRTGRTKYTQTLHNASRVAKHRRLPAVRNGARLGWQQTRSSGRGREIDRDSLFDEESDSEDGGRQLEFQNIRHIFRHHSVAPKPPSTDTLEHKMYIVGEAWDRWFLSFIDWALEHEPNHTKYSVFAQMSKVTKLPQLAFSTMALRLHSQVNAAFNRVRGNRSAMNIAPFLKAQEKSSVVEEGSEGGLDSTEMERESHCEQREPERNCVVGEERDEILPVEMADILESENLVPAEPESQQARQECGEESEAVVFHAGDGTTPDESQSFVAQECMKLPAIDAQIEEMSEGIDTQGN